MFQIKPSTLKGAGKGLFTTKPIKKGDIVVEYKGEILSWKQVKKRYPDLSQIDYIFHAGPNHWVDAALTPKEFARYANDAKGVSKVKTIRNNAEYQVIKRKPYIVATRNIPAGAEIFVDYGDSYWKNHYLS